MGDVLRDYVALLDLSTQDFDEDEMGHTVGDNDGDGPVPMGGRDLAVPQLVVQRLLAHARTDTAVWHLTQVCSPTTLLLFSLSSP